MVLFKWGLGIGDWGLGIGDWGLGPIPNPQSPFRIAKKLTRYIKLFISTLKFPEKDYKCKIKIKILFIFIVLFYYHQ